MTGMLQARFTTLLLAILSLALVALGAINYQQRGKFQLAEDGVSWTATDPGVKAWIVDHDGPGDRAGIREGDTLSAINGTPIKRADEAYRAIFSSGTWSNLDY